MEAIIGSILSYIVSLATSLHADAILTDQKQKLAAQLRPEEEARQALNAFRPLPEDVRRACVDLAGKHEQLWVSPQQERLRPLLSDAAFQSDFVE